MRTCTILPYLRKTVRTYVSPLFDRGHNNTNGDARISTNGMSMNTNSNSNSWPTSIIRPPWSSRILLIIARRVLVPDAAPVGAENVETHTVLWHARGEQYIGGRGHYGRRASFGMPRTNHQRSPPAKAFHVGSKYGTHRGGPHFDPNGLSSNPMQFSCDAKTKN